MKTPVVLDLQPLQSAATGDRGIARFAADHARALIAAGAPLAALMLDPALPPPRRLPPDLATSGLLAWNTPRVWGHATTGRPALYHLTSPFEDVRPSDALLPPHAALQAAGLVVTLYDTIPYVMAAEYQDNWWARQFLRRRAALIRTADLVLAISEHTGRDAVEALGVDAERVAVIGAGASEFFRPAGPHDDPAALLLRALPALRRPFVLTVSGFDPRKDPETLISAFALLPDDLRRTHQLVIACNLPPAAAARWGDHARARGLGPEDVLLTGYVDDEVLRALYQRSALFAFSSRYEGFGLPVLEAARCGCPAVAARTSALPEVLAHAPATFAPGDAGDLAAVLARGLADGSFRAELAEAGRRAATRHTWDAVARRTLDAYGTLEHRGRPPRRRRRRLALVGPLPPARTGVAVYDDRVARALARRAEVDCFAEPPRGGARSRPYRRFPAGALGRSFSPASYDSVVYALGNSPAHRRTLDLALRYPGVVWLHDANLAGLYLNVAGLYLPGVPTEAVDFDRARVVMREAVVRCAGRDAPDPGDDWWRFEAYAEAGLTMTEEVLRAARGVVVNTEEARDAVASRVTAGVPVHVVPHAVPGAPPPVDTEEGLVVAPGWVDANKRPHDVLRALARLRADVPARLAFVGEVDPGLRTELEALAGELDLTDHVVFTGFAPLADYRRWIGRAAVVLLLRQRSLGESSGALADALSARKPVLTSIATAAELPAGTVARVDPSAPAGDLAAALRRLLADEEERRRLSEAASLYAENWTFGHVAEALLDAAAAVAEPAFPDPLWA